MGARVVVAVLSSLFAGGVWLVPHPALAACNLIPQTTKIFQGTVGTTNRPFAAPGEPIEVAVRPCDSGSAGLSLNAADQVVTVLFTPGGSATPNAMVLTAGSCSTLSSEVAACQSQLGGGQALCIEGSAAGLQVVPRADGPHLQFLFPNTDALVGSIGDALTLAGPATIAVTQATASTLPCELATATCSAQAPSIAGLVACVDDFFTSDGACGTSLPQGTFNHFTALPVPNNFAGACLSDTVGLCSNSIASQLRLTADHDGNALLPMDWSGILVRTGGLPIPRLLSASLSTSPLSPQFTVILPGQSFFASFSPDGGPLAPIFVPQFDTTEPSPALNLFGSADAPYTVLRIARRSDHPAQCQGGGVHNGHACNGPDDCPGLCSAGANAGQRCTSDAACPGGACSAPAPGSCGPTVCFGGSNAGDACTADSFCPGGECGPSVFGLTPLVFDGNGPVVLPRQPGVCASGINSGEACTTFSQCSGSFCVTDGFCQQNTSLMCSLTNACSSVPCVDFQLEAENPIPLASLAAQTANVFGLTSLETVDLVDRNGDGDTVDAVVTLRNHTTGALQPLGAPAECIGHSTLSSTPVPQGRAVVQISQPPFLFPAVATEGDLVAFLESEPTEGSCDENGNGAIFDSILRVFRLGPTDLTAGTDQTIDAAALLNAQSVTISNGRVFFRQSEAQRARQQTTRASLNFSGGESNGNGSFATAMSASGRSVAFLSYATNLIPGGTNGALHVFVRDLVAGVTDLVSVDSSGAQANGNSNTTAISADGRYVAFGSSATNLVPGDTNVADDIFVHDRCISNGSFVPVCAPTTELASVGFLGQGDDASGNPAISADGRYVAFYSNATNLVPNDGNGVTDVFVHDRLTGDTERVSVDSAGVEGNFASGTLGFSGVAISADGRYVAFESTATNLDPPDANGVSSDVFVRDRCLSSGTPIASCTPTTKRVTVDSTGSQSNSASAVPSMSADGRYVAFSSIATNLVPGDMNGAEDIFVHDRLTGVTERVSVDSVGREANQGSSMSMFAMSADGRYVAFDTSATNLVPGDTNTKNDIFVHDRLTGATQRLSLDSTGNQANDHSYGAAISGDGGSVAFQTDATNLGPPDTNAVSDIIVRGADPNDGASDITGDGDNKDTVLGMLDTTQGSPISVSLCPADVVSVAGGVAAFLRPESAGSTPNLPNCPVGTAVSGGVDLNGNGNAGDEVVHLALDSTTIQNFGVAATAVSLSGTCVGGANNNFPCVDDTDCSGSTCVASALAVLVSEAGQNTDLNNDGDLFDTVVAVQPLGAGPWTNVNQAADTVQVEGTLVAFLTPEADQGNTDLNGDRDKSDRVLQVYDAATGHRTNVEQAAEEFVMGTQPASCGSGPLIAFRTSEAAQGNTDLNGDGDATDYVLQLYVPGVGLINTHEAVTPCALPACDPRHPYLVQGDTVKFLTYEGDQRQDLNGNGNQTDLILQIFDACTRTLTMVGTVDTTVANVDPLTNGGTAAQSKAAFATTAGACMSGLTTYLVPAMCSSDADCPMGATCQPGNSIVSAPAVIPTHYDSVVTPHGPLTVVIPLGQASVAATLKLKVANGDVQPVKEKPGHTVQLTVSDGTCPAGTVAGLPDFSAKAAGAQSSVLLKGGAAKSAKVPLLITSSKFATVNHSAPYRCALAVSVTTANVDDNIDPTPANNSVPVELNVIDQNNLQASSAADAVIKSVRPVQLTIGKHAPTMSATRTLTVRLLNADSVPASLTATATDGTCPVGTVRVSTPAPVQVAAGASARVKLQVTATNAAFLTANGVARSRCIATVNVASAGTDPDPTNNTAQLVIDVTDKEDF
jgi:Tol biopolymer transport system component